MLCPCQNLAHSLVLSGCSKSQRRPLCLGWDLFRRRSDRGCVCVCTFASESVCIWVCFAFKSLFLARHMLLSTQMFLSEAGISREELRKGKEPSACP